VIFIERDKTKIFFPRKHLPRYIKSNFEFDENGRGSIKKEEKEDKSI
jgi:hypothetical protein